MSAGSWQTARPGEGGVLRRLQLQTLSQFNVLRAELRQAAQNDARPHRTTPGRTERSLAAQNGPRPHRTVPGRTERSQATQNGPASQHNVLWPNYVYETFIWTVRKAIQILNETICVLHAQQLFVNRFINFHHHDKETTSIDLAKHKIAP